MRDTASTLRAPVPVRSRRPGPQQEIPRPRLTLVRPRPIRPARAPFVLLVVGLLGGGLITLLMLNTALNQGSFELARLRQQTAGLAIVEQTLRQEVDTISTPERLAERAREFGMVPADSVAFLNTATGQIIGVPKPAAAPPAAAPPAGSGTAPGATRGNVAPQGAVDPVTGSGTDADRAPAPARPAGAPAPGTNPVKPAGAPAPGTKPVKPATAASPVKAGQTGAPAGSGTSSGTASTAADRG